MSIINFYCDESGQTGTNFTDTSQPFYVLGGWLSTEKTLDLSALLPEKEYKSSTLLKSVEGRNKISKLLRVARESNLIPVVCIVEKRYAIAARIVETLLDPEFNTSVDYSITRDEWFISKSEIADTLYTLPATILYPFEKSFINNDIDGIIKSINSICEYLQDAKETSLAYLISESLPNIYGNTAFHKYDEEDDFFEHGDNISCEKVYNSMNWFTFSTLLRELDLIGESLNKKIAIIHDNQSTYDKSFYSMFEKVCNVDKILENKYISFQHEYEKVFKDRIVDLSFKDSKEDIYIQLADILVGTLNYILKYNKNNFKDSSLKNIINELSLLIEFISCRGIMISKNEFNKFKDKFIKFNKTEI